MSSEENPYASPAPFIDDRAQASNALRPQILLTSFLGLQAGGMLGVISGLLAPLRYLMGPVPLDVVLLEDISSNVRVQIIGESIFIAISCLVFGATIGAVLEIGDKLILTSVRASQWFLLSSLKIHKVSLRGLLFAIVCTAPPLLILTASYSRKDAFLGLHANWALAHLLIAIYFGERFSAACQKIDADSIKTEHSPST